MAEISREVQSLSAEAASRIVRSIGELGISTIVLPDQTKSPEEEAVTLSRGGIIVRDKTPYEARHAHHLYKLHRKNVIEQPDTGMVTEFADPYFIDLKVAVISNTFSRVIFSTDKGNQHAIDPVRSAHYLFKEEDGIWKGKKIFYPDSKTSFEIDHPSELTVYYVKRAIGLETTEQLEPVMTLLDRYERYIGDTEL